MSREKTAFYYSARMPSGASLMTDTGRRNDTMIAKYLGQDGSRKESSWNGAEHRHTCCDSKVSWRHKNGCPKVAERARV